MVLYTPLALEQVLGPPSEGAAEMLVEVDQRPCVVRVGSGGRGRLERQLPTDPRDFLDPRWQPGQVVE